MSEQHQYDRKHRLFSSYICTMLTSLRYSLELFLPFVPVEPHTSLYFVPIVQFPS